MNSKDLDNLDGVIEVIRNDLWEFLGVTKFTINELGYIRHYKATLTHSDKELMAERGYILLSTKHKKKGTRCKWFRVSSPFKFSGNTSTGYHSCNQFGSDYNPAYVKLSDRSTPY